MNYNLEIPSTLRHFISRYLKIKKNKRLMIGILAMFTIYALEGSISPYLLGKMVSIVSNYNSSKPFLSLILWPAIFYAMMPMITNIAVRLKEYFEACLYPSMKSDIKKDMFEYLLGHSYEFFESNFSGTLTKKIIDISENIEELLKIASGWIYNSVLGILIAVLTLYLFVGGLYALILFTWAILFVGISFITADTTQTASAELASAKTKLSGYLSDSISNISSTILFSGSNKESKTIQKAVTEVAKSEKKIQCQMIKVFFYQGCLVTTLISAFVCALIYGAQKHSIHAGDIALVLSISLSCLMMIFGLGQQILKVHQLIGACNDALSFIKIPHAIIDKPNVPPLQVSKGEILFDNINFSYPNSALLFNQLNLSIAAGEKIGIVGKSGSGKSTLLKLLLRLVEPFSGNIVIDKQRISEVQFKSLRSQITIIPQETQLFHRSIFDNIHFANDTATKDEVISAAKKANCHDFIMNLPEQYNTLVGERGLKLSGGQKQRISIARAFLRNTKILILDEATSSLDTETEQAIQKSLHEVMQDKTTLIISHRLSTLQEVDAIVVIDNGKIIEHGSLELLTKKQGGVFAALWKTQVGGFLFAETSTI